ncbi:MAG: hypothetical protein J6R01_02615 [Alistipes sp.]|nr:hypothetical protein [Alistipes sp.]
MKISELFYTFVRIFGKVAPSGLNFKEIAAKKIEEIYDKINLKTKNYGEQQTSGAYPKAL